MKTKSRQQLDQEKRILDNRVKMLIMESDFCCCRESCSEHSDVFCCMYPVCSEYRFCEVI